MNEDVKSFLTNYIKVKENVVLLAGRIPGFKNDNIKLLSSSDTKMSVWLDFKKACETEKQAVSYTKFIDLWHQFNLNVVVVKPMTDLFNLPTKHFKATAICQPSRPGKIRVRPGPARTSGLCSNRKRAL